MKNVRWILFALLVVAGCGGEIASSAGDQELVEEQQQVLDPPEALAFTGLELVDLSEVEPLNELLDGVPFDVEVYQLVVDPGTEWEIPLVVPVPSGWSFDSSLSGFTDGSSSISLTTGCIGPCQPVAWPIALINPGNFLDPVGDPPAYGNRRNGDGGTGFFSTVNDDGPGFTRVAHYHDDGARFVGCTGTVQSSDVEVLSLWRLCESIEPDWTTVLSNSGEPTINQVKTASVSDIIENPMPAGSPRNVPVDHRDPEREVFITLPEESATLTFGLFGSVMSLGADWSTESVLSLNIGCDGSCTPQNWEQKLNSAASILGQNRAQLDLDNDTAIDSGWLVTGTPRANEDQYKVVLLRWDNDADSYFICEFQLDESDVERSHEAIAICLSAEPNWIGS